MSQVCIYTGDKGSAVYLSTPYLFEFESVKGRGTRLRRLAGPRGYRIRKSIYYSDTPSIHLLLSFEITASVSAIILCNRPLGGT